LGSAESRKGALRTMSGRMTPKMATLMMLRISHKARAWEWSGQLTGPSPSENKGSRRMDLKGCPSLPARLSHRLCVGCKMWKAAL
jgi:hypothetical protein